nr:retrovirus-related Pol polyprotein from transposon TNT 1-94 [Tanacetum cinerariifolium]
MQDEFEKSMMEELNFFLGLHMEDGIFFNQSKHIKEMLKKFGLEDSKPTKTSMSTEIKLTKDDEADSVDSIKHRGEIMLQIFHDELQQTISYVPKISNENLTPQNLIVTFINLESRGIHEGRVVLPYYSKH